MTEWITLYENGSNRIQISRKYGVSVSTVRRYISRHIDLRNPHEAIAIASTKYEKKPFSGDPCKAGFIAGYLEDFHVREEGRQIEVTTSTTHPAMGRLFQNIFGAYGHTKLYPSFEKTGRYYRYYLSVYLDRSFATVLRKSAKLPGWIPQEKDNPIFQSYLSGLIAAEGCVSMFRNHNLADCLVYIMIDKPRLLRELSRTIGGRIYAVERAWRLVIYGIPAVNLLRRLDLRHEEKIAKSLLVVNHTGRRWEDVEAIWRDLIKKIKVQVKGPIASARTDYIALRGALHPDEKQANSGS